MNMTIQLKKATIFLVFLLSLMSINSIIYGQQKKEGNIQNDDIRCKVVFEVLKKWMNSDKEMNDELKSLMQTNLEALKNVKKFELSAYQESFKYVKRIFIGVDILLKNFDIILNMLDNCVVFK